jgi:membrane protein implicated in regulation of membrane protease activity
MSEVPTEPDPRPGHRPLPVGVAVVALVLLAIPVVLLLIVPLYARSTPELWGFPFFYWFQMLMVIVASVLTYLAYALVQNARRGKGGDR